MVACWLVFGYIPASDLVIVAGISVVLFFVLGRMMAINWVRAGELWYNLRKYGRYRLVYGVRKRFSGMDARRYTYVFGSDHRNQ